MIRVIFNQKGGVGKSSIAVNLAALSAEYGFRTLLIDLDSQGNSSQYLLGEEFSSVERTITGYFVQSLTFSIMADPAVDYVSRTPYPNLDLVAADAELAEIQQKLETKHKIYKLRDFIESLSDDYDMVYIDTPPAFNFYTLSALIAADRCIIPFDCDDFSLLLKARFAYAAYREPDKYQNRPYCLGIVWGLLPFPFPHSMNWVVTDDYEFHFIEPQRQEIISLDQCQQYRYINFMMV